MGRIFAMGVGLLAVLTLVTVGLAQLVLQPPTKDLTLLAAFLLPAIPLVAVAWSAVNDVAAGQLERLVVAIPATAAFAVLLAIFGRLLRRLDAGR